MRGIKGLAVIGMLGATALAFGCSSDGGDASNQHAGTAAEAVAQIFTQERAGGVLPETGVDIVPRGVKTNSIIELGVPDGGNVEARYCMEYTYIAATEQRNRVYVAELVDGAWEVESVNPNGTCEGVT